MSIKQEYQVDQEILLENFFTKTQIKDIAANKLYPQSGSKKLSLMTND